MKGAPMALVVFAAFSGCGKDDKRSTTTIQATSTSDPMVTEGPKLPTAPAVPEKVAPHVEIQLASVADQMAFDKKALTVPAGAEVHLVLKDNAKVSTLSHNWALVKPGTEASVAAAGLKRGEAAGYVDVMDRDMLAFAPLAKPGGTTEVTFTAPGEAGAYPYICTMPGHYLMMKGVLTVTP